MSQPTLPATDATPLDGSQEARSAQWRGEVTFWALMLAGAAAIPFMLPYPHIGMWFCFAVAARSAIGNDSIQTLGTFIRSNSTVPWWFLALFIAGIQVTTHTTGWFLDDGDIAFGRLQEIPHPGKLTLLHMVAPLMLLVMTRYGVPLSTTFFLLSMFSSGTVISKMITKSVLGYGIALVVAFAVWGIFAYLRRNSTPMPYNVRAWRIAQWLTTSFLWYSWIVHDTANIAVFLPRQLEFSQLLIAMGIIIFVVASVMVTRGGQIQEIVNQKSRTDDVREATAIDFVYCIILFIFKEWSHVPMSTTWIFLGLLAGRECAMSFRANRAVSLGHAVLKAFRDVGLALVGLTVSLLLAYYGDLWIALAGMTVALIGNGLFTMWLKKRSNKPTPTPAS